MARDHLASIFNSSRVIFSTPNTINIINIIRIHKSFQNNLYLCKYTLHKCEKNTIVTIKVFRTSWPEQTFVVFVNERKKSTTTPQGWTFKNWHFPYMYNIYLLLTIGPCINIILGLGRAMRKYVLASLRVLVFYIPRM